MMKLNSKKIIIGLIATFIIAISGMGVYNYILSNENMPALEEKMIAAAKKYIENHNIDVADTIAIDTRKLDLGEKNEYTENSLVTATKKEDGLIYEANVRTVDDYTLSQLSKPLGFALREASGDVSENEFVVTQFQSNLFKGIENGIYVKYEIATNKNVEIRLDGNVPFKVEVLDKDGNWISSDSESILDADGETKWTSSDEHNTVWTKVFSKNVTTKVRVVPNIASLEAYAVDINIEKIDKEAPKMTVNNQPVKDYYSDIRGLIIEDDNNMKVKVSFTSVDGETLTEELIGVLTNGKYVAEVALDKEGTYIVEATDEVTNNVDDTRNSSSATIIVDLHDPIIMVNDNEVIAPYYENDAILNISDVLSGIKTITATREGQTITLSEGENTLSEEGIYNITVTDNADRSTSVSFSIDANAPVVVDDSIVNDKHYSVDSKTVVITDRIPFRVIIDGTEYNAIEQADKTYKYEFTKAEEGKYTVEAIDSLGHSTDEITFVIDRTEPTILLNDEAPKKYYTGDVKVTFNDIAPGEVESVTVDGEKKNITEAIVVSGEKKHTVVVTDKAGNSISVEYINDNTSPVFKLNGSTTLQKLYASEVKVEANDTTTVTFYEVIKAATDTEAEEVALLGTDLVKITTDGSHTIKAVDEAGNSSYVTFKVDAANPELKINGSTIIKEYYNASDLVNGKLVLDATEENVEYYLVEDNNKTKLNSNELTQNKTYTIIVRDEAGNESEPKTFTLDTEVPVLRLNSDSSENNSLKDYYNKTNATNGVIVSSNDSTAKFYLVNGDIETELTDLTIAVDGSYTVRVKDVAGNMVDHTFTLDRVGPTIIVNDSVIANDNTHYYQSLVDVTVEDTTSGVFSVMNGITNIPSFENGFELDDGKYTLTVTDKAGNASSATIVVDLDNPIVKVNNSEIINPYYIVNANLEISDVRSGIKSITATKNNIEIENFQSSMTNTNNVYTKSITEDGLYTIKVVDNAGRETIISFTVDKTVPSILINEKEEKDYYNKADGDLTLTVTTVEEEVTFYEVTEETVDGEIKEVLTPITNVVTEEGNHKIVAIDKAGNRSQEVTFIVDRTAPVMLINTEAPKAFYNKVDGELNFSVSNTEANGVKYYKVTYVTEEIEGSEEVTTKEQLDEITNNKITTDGTYTVIAIDTAGNRSEMAEFTRDTVDLTLLIEGITPVTYYSTKPLTLSTNKKTGVTFYLVDSTGNETVLENKRITADGFYHIRVRDIVGNTDEKEFIVDTTRPILKIDNVEATHNGVYYYDREVTVTIGDLTSGINESATKVNDQSTIIDSSGIIIPSGRHVIKIEDNARNTTTVTIVVDMDKPEIELNDNSILKDVYGNDVKVKITDTLSGIKTITATKDGVEIEEFQNNMTAIKGVYTTTIKEDGVYTITATDNSGKIETVTFTRDTIAPTIKLNGILSTDKDFKTLYNGSVEVSSDDKTTVTYGIVVKNQTELGVMPENNIFTEAGIYTVRATDAAGNHSEITFTIDKTAPSLKINDSDIIKRYYNLNDNKENKNELVLSATKQNVKYYEADGITEITNLTITEDGTYTVIVKDMAGNASEPVTFTRDTVAPTLEVNNETAKDFYNLTDASDLVLSASEENVKYYEADGTTEITNLTINTDGTYTVIVEDIAGNRSNPVTFTRDTVVPELKVNGEAVKDFYNLNDNKENGNKLVLSASEENVKYYEADGTTEITNLTINTDGTYTIIVEDAAGNRSNPVTFTRDTLASNLKLNDSTELKDYYNNKNAQNGVIVSSDDENAKFYLVSGEVESELTELTITVDGTYTVRVKDTAGNTVDHTFTLDRVSPTIKIGEMVLTNGEKYYYNDSVYLTYEDTVSDILSVTSNGQMIPNFENGLEITESKEHVVKVTDKAGNETTVTIMIDVTAPIIEVGGDTENHKSVYGGNVTVKIIDEESGIKSILATRDGRGTVVSQDTKLRTDGLYVITVENNAGGSTTVTFRVDGTDPVIQINGGTVKDSYNLTDDSNLVLSAIDDTNVTFYRVLNETETVLDNLTINSDGTYVIKAVDEAGNTSTVTFTRDTAVPELKVNGDAVKDFYNLNDNKENGNKLVLSASEENVKYYEADGTTEITNLTITEDGTYTVIVKDMAGNASEPVTFTRDTVAPTLEVNNETAKDFYNLTDASDLVLSASEENVKYYEADGTTEITNLTINTDGTYTVIVEDAAGNRSNPVTFTRDTVVPELKVNGEAAKDFYNSTDASDLVLSASEENVKYYEADGTTEITNLTITEDGTYTVIVEDAAGNRSNPVTFTRDTTAPTLKLNDSTKLKDYYNNKNAENGVTVSSDDESAKFYFVNGEVETELTNLTITEDGTYTVRVKDEAGNKIDHTFTLDRVNPTIKIDGNIITNGETYYYDNNVIVTIEDATSGINAGATKINNVASVIGAEGIEVQNGKYVISIEDNAGNNAEVTVIVDADKPVIELDDSTTLKDFYGKDVKVKVSDSLSGIKTIVATKDGVEIEGFQDDMTNKDDVYTTTIKEDGVYTITATDNSGKTETVTFTRDTIAPTIMLNGLKSTDEGYKTLFNTSVTVTADDKTTLTFHKVTTKASEGVEEVLEELQENPIFSEIGTYTVKVEDAAGNSSYVTFTIDTSVPKLLVNNKDVKEIYNLNDYKNNGNKFVLSSNKESVKFYTIAEDGTETELTNLTLDSNPDGVYTVIVEDIAGNRSDAVTFTIDTTVPSILINGKEEKDYYNKADGDLTLTVTTVEEEVTFYEVTEETVDGETKEVLTPITNVITEEGNHKIVAIDKAGNRSQEVIFIVDRTAPVILINTEAPKAFYNKADGELNFSVSNTEANGVKYYKVTYVTEEIEGSEEVTTKEQLDEITNNKITTDGAYTVIAIDAAGNRSEIVEFTRDTEVPNLKLNNSTELKEYYNNTNAENGVTVSSDDESAKFYFVNGEVETELTNLTITEDGTYTVRVKDEAGNKIDHTFTLDRVNPTIKIDGNIITNGETYYYDNNVIVTIEDATSGINAGATKINNVASVIGADGIEVQSGKSIIKIEDNAGNEATVTIIIDETAPIVEVDGDTENHKSVYGKDITVKIKDEESGVKSISATRDGNVIEIDTDTTLKTDGLYIITVENNAGGITTVTFRVDGTNPIIKLNDVLSTDENFKTIYNGNVVVSSEDATTVTYGIVVEGQNELDTMPANNTFTDNGTYTVRATDEAGNYSDITFTIDMTIPTLLINGESVKEFYNLNDNKENENKLVLSSSKENVKFYEADGITEITDLTIDTDGTYTVIVKDEAGNASEPVTFTRDTVAPDIIIEGGNLIIVEKGKEIKFPTVTAMDGTVELTVTDDRETVGVDNNNAADYVITFTATDEAGNVTNKKYTIRVLNLDKLRQEEAKLRDLEYFADDEDIYGVINENKNDYTVESWDAKKDLIDELNNIVSGNSDMELKDITQEFVDGKMKEIEATKLVAKELDRTKYEEQINKFDSLVEEDYEADSWQIAETSRNQSIENVKIQSKLNEITYRIEQDIKNLVPANFERYVTTTVLQLQTKLWDYTRSDYTNESYNEAQDKINNLKYQTIYYGGPINVKSEYDKILKEVDLDKILVPLPISDEQKKRLEDLKADLENNYNEEDYTPESWKKVQDAIAATDAVVEKPGLRSEFETAFENINLNELVAYPKVLTQNLVTSNSTNYAKVEEDLILTFTSNTTLDLTENKTIVMINGKLATIEPTANGYRATVTVEKNDTNGNVSYSITLVGTNGLTGTVDPTQTEIIVDTKKPFVNEKVKSAYNSDVNLTFDDETSGIQNVILTKDGEEVSGVNLDEKTISIVANELNEGHYTLTLVDNAENKEEYTFDLDITDPVITIGEETLVDGKTYYYNHDITLNISDLVSGIYSVNGQTATEFLNTLNITTTGTHTVTVVDNAKNDIVVTIIYDTETPKVLLNGEEPKAGKNLFEENVILSSNKDAIDRFEILTGIDEEGNPVYRTLTEEELTFVKENNGEYTVRVIDKAGNPSDDITFVIDTEKPVVKVNGVVEETENSGKFYKDPVTITAEDTTNLEYQVYSILDGKETTIEMPENNTFNEEGTYKVVVKDELEHSFTVTFTYDKTAPIIKLNGVSNTDNEFKTLFKDVVTVVAEDATTVELKLVETEVNEEGELVEKLVDMPKDNIFDKEGTYTVRATDLAQNQTEVTFTYDKTAPTIKLNGKTSKDEGYKTMYNETVNVTADDLTLLTFYRVTTEATEDTEEVLEELSANPSFTLEGTYTIKVVDTIGNSSYVTFTIDKEVPTILIGGNAPVANYNSTYNVENNNALVLSSNKENVTFYTVDENGTETKLTNLTITNDGTYTVIVKDEAGNVSEPVTFTRDTFLANILLNNEEPKTYYDKKTESVIISLDNNEEEVMFYTVDKLGNETQLENLTITNDGTYTVRIKDNAGNSKEVTFTLDKNAPEVMGVKHGSNYSNDKLTIIVKDATEMTATLNGEKVDFEYEETENGMYQFTIEVSEERVHSLVVTDAAKNKTTVAFIIDRTAPKIFGVITENDVETTIEDLNGKVFDKDITVKYSDDGRFKSATVNGEAFTDSKTVSEEGIYTVVVEDKAGNKSEVTFTIDKKGPEFTNVEDGKSYNISIFENDGGIIITDRTQITVELDETIYTSTEQSDGTHKLVIPVEVDGDYTITAKDAANHETTVTFTVDSEAPTIQINGENPKLYYNKEEGKAVLSALNNEEVIFYTVDAEGNKAELKNTTITENGTYTVIAVDKALNESASVTFTIDKEIPTILINGETPVDYYNKADGNVVLSSDKEVTFYLVNGESKTELTNLVITNDGTYTVVAEDIAGNISESVTFTIDKEIPTILINGEEPKAYYNKDVEKVILSALNNEEVTFYTIDEEGNETKLTSLELTENGTYTVIAKDKALNESIRVTFTIDKVVPTIKINGKAPVRYYNKRDGKAELSADKEGVTFYSISGENRTALTDLVILTDGTYTIEAEDEAGNISSQVVFTLDTVAPIISGVENTGIYNKDLIIEANENGVVFTIGGQTYIEGEIYGIEGQHNLVATDMAGNTTNITFLLDKTAPEITLPKEVKEENGKYVIDVEAIKDGGLYTVPTAEVEDNLDKEITEAEVIGEVNLGLKEEQTIEYVATDMAKNTTRIEVIVRVSDTTKPEINLENETITIPYGTKYLDQKPTATDNFDGDISSRVIEVSNNVNTYVPGTYYIEYSVTDLSGNKATAKRTIIVENATTSNIIGSCEAGEDCYNISENDNYVWYSGHLWRIFKVNADGTIKMITEDSVAGFSYDDDSNSFTGSHAEEWLNDYFYDSLNNSNKIIAETNYCNKVVGKDSPTATNTCSSKYLVKANVGLLTIDEYILAGDKDSFLNNGDYFFTMTPGYTFGTEYIWAIELDGKKVRGHNVKQTYSMRPVITVNSNVNISGGTGTKENPYRLEGDESGNAKTALNKRFSGEYVNFAGYTWRIVVTKDTTRLITDTYFMKDGEYVRSSYGSTNLFNTTEEGSIGYYLNTTVLNDLFPDKNSAEYNALVKNALWHYNPYAEGENPIDTTLRSGTNKLEAAIGLPRIGELMSGNSSTLPEYNLAIWTLNPVKGTTTSAWNISWAGTIGTNTVDQPRRIRPVIELKSNVMIKSGNGTYQNPYELDL